MVMSLILLLTAVTVTNGAKILAIAPLPSYSHQRFYRPIWKELANRGHQLTLLTTDPMEDPPENIRQINWHFTYELRHTKYNVTKVMQEHRYNIHKMLNFFQIVMNEIVDSELAVPEVQVMLKNESERFDLVIVEYFHPVLFAFSQRFNCPYITISSADISIYYHRMFGNPIHPVLYPDWLLPFERNLNFQQRLVSTLYVGYFFWRQAVNTAGVEEALARKYFGNDLPPLEKIIRNVSMVFLNTNPLFSVRPLGPGFIRIGSGMHLEKDKPLPKDFDEYLGSAIEGAIYFSLGTNVKSHHLSENVTRVFVDAFRELPYKILWKFETALEDKPDNVRIDKWLPQQDILRHKNIKLFITQCGAQSMEEAIFGGVPMIAIPFVGDQQMNAQKVLRLGLGLTLNKNTLTKNLLKRAIIEVISNSSYRRRVKEVAKLLQDEPMSGLEKAIWWTEYVIRHKGVKHFWHPNLDIPMYQYLLLDVIGFLVLVASVSVYTFGKIFRIFIICILSLKKKIQPLKQKSS